jgi:hypothetical protein
MKLTVETDYGNFVPGRPDYDLLTGSFENEKISIEYWCNLLVIYTR